MRVWREGSNRLRRQLQVLGFIVAMQGAINLLLTLRARLIGFGPAPSDWMAELLAFAAACAVAYGCYGVIAWAGRRGHAMRFAAAALTAPVAASLWEACFVVIFRALAGRHELSLQQALSLPGSFEAVMMFVGNCTALAVLSAYFDGQGGVSALKPIPLASPVSSADASRAAQAALDGDLWCSDGRQQIRIALAEIYALTAEVDYVRVHAVGRRPLVRGPLKKLAEALPAQHFMRIHRSVVVRLSAVRSLERVGRTWWVELADGARHPIGRGLINDVRRRLELRPGSSTFGASAVE